MPVAISNASEASLTVAFIENLSMVEGFANQGITLRIAPGGVLWVPRQEVDGKIWRDSIQNLQRLAESSTLKRKHDQKVHVRIGSRLAIGIGTK
jgi:hypothetical protein